MNTKTFVIRLCRHSDPNAFVGSVTRSGLLTIKPTAHAARKYTYRGAARLCKLIDPSLEPVVI